jgi:phosphoribosyl-AMP cyclohydrolase
VSDEVNDTVSDTVETEIARVTWNDAGLAPVIVQQYDTREVLMLAWMDAEALRRTLTGGRAVYWSRSRQEYWRKGDTSGNTQRVHSLAVDCDADTILLTVDQHGPACHTGTHTCFDGRELTVTGGE